VRDTLYRNGLTGVKRRHFLEDKPASTGYEGATDRSGFSGFYGLHQKEALLTMPIMLLC